MKRTFLCLCIMPLVLALVACAPMAEPEAEAPAPAASDGPARSIANITGDLYRAQNDAHHTVFLVTEEGIIMSDPINQDFATYLKAEFEERYAQPVRYVLYSHTDWDHASGGEVFADTAEFIGHENMTAALAAPGEMALPENVAELDANGNGEIEPAEATGNFGNLFAQYDADARTDLTGVLIKVEWLNPHAYFYLDVEDPETGEVTTWACELGSPVSMLRQGWTRESLVLGEIFEVEGALARDGSASMNASRVVIENTGERLFSRRQD